MKKFSYYILLFISLLLIPSSYVFAEEPIRVMLDGKQLSFSESPLIDNGSTLVQFRPIFENLGLYLTESPYNPFLVRIKQEEIKEQQEYYYFRRMKYREYVNAFELDQIKR
jgi:hypothetical protein